MVAFNIIIFHKCPTISSHYTVELIESYDINTQWENVKLELAGLLLIGVYGEIDTPH